MYDPILILGVALWSGAHLFKRLQPERRARLGDEVKAPVAIMLVASVVLMVIGYRGAEGAFFWSRSPAMAGINNLLMLVAFYIYAAVPPAGPKRDRVGAGCATRSWSAFAVLCRGASGGQWRCRRPSSCSAGSWPGR